MQNDKSSDYLAPYRDHTSASEQDEINRVVGIGKANLLAWWNRVKADTSPSTYGHTDHDFTSSVAYLVAGGSISRYLYGNSNAADVRACHALGVEPNFVGSAA